MGPGQGWEEGGVPYVGQPHSEAVDDAGRVLNDGLHLVKHGARERGDEEDVEQLEVVQLDQLLALEAAERLPALENRQPCGSIMSVGEKCAPVRTDDNLHGT
jgi:hypothetical protein